MDNATALGEHLAYARCFVEVAASKQLPQMISLELEEEERVTIPVEYEWVPPCKSYVNFGHVDTQCPFVKVWNPKETVNVQEHHVSVPHTQQNTGISEEQKKARNSTGADFIHGYKNCECEVGGKSSGGVPNTIYISVTEIVSELETPVVVHVEGTGESYGERVDIISDGGLLILFVSDYLNLVSPVVSL